MSSLKSTRSVKLPAPNLLLDMNEFMSNSTKLNAICVGRIIAFFIILSYVIKVENKCNRCVNDTNLKSIKYMSIGFIIYNILLFSFPNLLDVRVEILSYLVYIIYIISIIKYVKKMNTHETCSSCSKDWRKTFMNIFAYITIILISISGLLTILFGFM